MKSVGVIEGNITGKSRLLHMCLVVEMADLYLLAEEARQIHLDERSAMLNQEFGEWDHP